jgi:hypothetical protein
MKTSTLAGTPDRSAPAAEIFRRYLEADSPSRSATGCLRCARKRRMTWRLGMPEGPVGLCFFEQFVLQTGVNNDKQCPNTHMR